MKTMKKFYCYVASLLVAAGAMVGCTEDITTDNILSNEGLNNVEFVEVTADLEDEESRTTLTDGGNGGKVVWSEGDSIGAIATDGTVTECVAKSINGSSATFEIPSNALYAIYPYTTDYNYSANASSFGHRLAKNITLDGTNMVFDDKEDVMVAQLVDGNLMFRHLCGYIEVKLKGSETVKHIALRSNTRKWDALSGLAYIPLNSFSAPKANFSTGHKAAFNWIYATCNNVQLSKSEAKSFYFIVPPRTYENLTVCVQTDNGSYSVTAKSAVEVNRAKIRPLAAIDLDALEPASATDLSAEGLANCYIVPQGSDAKYYSFPAQRLNEVEKLANVKYAHILWSDREQVITNVNYNATTGTVSFKYAGGNKEGNVMVSVFDANHNSIWTWHIWCTDQPKVVKIKNAQNTTDKYHGLMDRNLGATYAPTTLNEAANISAENATAAMGLYYQYGRPIPFPKATSITNTTAESVDARFGANSDFELMYGFKDNLQCFQYTTYGNTFSTMLAHPLIYGAVYFTTYMGTTASSSKTKCHSFCKDFPRPDGSLTWHSENADVVSRKGSNDPCPPGYCIDDWDTFKSALYNIQQNRIYQDASTPEKTYGYSYQCPTTKEVAWFPASGYRTEDGVYTSVGRVSHLWAWRTFTDSRLYAVDYYTTEAATTNTDKYLTTGTNAIGLGYNVRCRLQDRSDLQTVPAEPEEKPTLSILFVGNSLTQDGIAYLPYMLKNYYPEITFHIYMWYRGGNTLGQQYSNFTTSGGTAEIFSVAENSEKWTNYTRSMTMANVLSNYKFDIVCMQEYFNYKDSYTDCTDWDNCKNYISNYYKGGNELKFMSLLHAPLRKDGVDTDAVYERTKAGNALILQKTVSEDLIPFGIAVQKALKNSNLNTLGDLGKLTPDGTHTQEGLPCLLQTYVALEWIFDKFDINKTVKGNTFRMTKAIYDKISVPGANLGSGVVEGTESQYSLAQDIAIEAYEEGKQFLQENLK